MNELSRVTRWRHRIPLPGGVVTPGSQDTAAQLQRLQLPERLSGLTVLDIGCSDGFFSFECEKRGAARVLAVDNFSSVYIDTPSSDTWTDAARQLGAFVWALSGRLWRRSGDISAHGNMLS